MRELMVTNDAVLLTFVESLLNEAEITAAVLDRNMSILEGSVGILPRRVLVDAEDLPRAIRLLTDAGLQQWISSNARV